MSFAGPKDSVIVDRCRCHRLPDIIRFRILYIPCPWLPDTIRVRILSAVSRLSKLPKSINNAPKRAFPVEFHPRRQEAQAHAGCPLRPPRGAQEQTPANFALLDHRGRHRLDTRPRGGQRGFSSCRMAASEGGAVARCRHQPAGVKGEHQIRAYNPLQGIPGADVTPPRT